jgi:hypothetical protein
MPDFTETDQQQVQGRDEKTRRITNKFKNAVEDTAMGGIFDIGLGLGLTTAKGVGIVGSAALKSKPVKPIVEKTKDISQRVYDAGLKDSLVENFAKRNLTSFRGLNPKDANEIELALQQAKEVDRASYVAATDFDTAARQVLKDSLKQDKDAGASTLKMSQIRTDLESVLSGKQVLDDIEYMTPELRRSIERMQLISARTTDDLLKTLEEEIAIAPTNTVRSQKAQEALGEIRKNQEKKIFINN